VFSFGPRSFVHRAFALGMASLAASELFAGLGASAQWLSDVVRWERLRLLFLAPVPGLWLLYSLSFARSNYRELVVRWRWTVAALLLGPIVLASVFGGSLFAIPPEWNEFVTSVLPLGWAGRSLHVLLLIGAVAALTQLERTLRAAGGGKRWQTKFMVLGVGSWLAAQIYFTSQAVLFTAIDRSLTAMESWVVLVAGGLVILSLIRNPLLAAEIYLSDTALYRSVVLLMTGGYLIAVGILASLIDMAGGSERFSLDVLFIFLALVVLAVLLLSDSLRLRVRRFVARHFQRPRYDYRREWTTFTERTTSLVDVHTLCAAITKRAAEIFGIAAATVWLIDEAPGEPIFGGSTSLSETQSLTDVELLRAVGQLARAMRDRRAVVDLHTAHSDELVALRGELSNVLASRQIRYIVPLIATRRLLGVMTLGDRASGEPLSFEDHDLLRTIGDQAAGALLNLQLSQRLVRAKEMEAFQTLSAFFTHDLKNLASMLSLTVQNLPSNFANAEFREDALRVISDSVAKMNAMCSRLATLHRELELNPRPVDLNELVHGTLQSLNGTLRARVQEDLQPVAKVSADPEQIEKVMLNLLLNANDAIGERGTIRVTSRERNGWVVVAVADDGCGMRPEFVARSLFQPFQTTKSQGLGIGLFQSRRIVEAHRGRIEVESELDKGSVFRVELPVG
jgi:putative PEP-CTERM system histidine kinase